MQHEVTRDLVNDLWPLYQAGEASDDSQALVAALFPTKSTWFRPLPLLMFVALAVALPATWFWPGGSASRISNSRCRQRRTRSTGSAP